jgi:hypothetical protein
MNHWERWLSLLPFYGDALVVAAVTLLLWWLA